jgi:hypothetical protein
MSLYQSIVQAQAASLFCLLSAFASHLCNWCRLPFLLPWVKSSQLQVMREAPPSNAVRVQALSVTVFSAFGFVL